MKAKGKYHIRNWKEYNKSLIYSDEAILTTLMISPTLKSPSRIFDIFSYANGSGASNSLQYSNLQKGQTSRTRTQQAF